MDDQLKIGFFVIAKDKASIIERLLTSTKGVFHSYYLQDTGSSDNTVEIFEAWCKKNNKPFKTSRKSLGKDYEFVLVHGKPTLAEFHKARNDSFNLAKEDDKYIVDFAFWADTDDVIVNAEAIYQVAQTMRERGERISFARYDYAQRIDGISPSTQVRERLIDLSYPGRWQFEVHETYEVDGLNSMPVTYSDYWVEHFRDINQVNETGRRNNLIMTKVLKEKGIDGISIKMLRDLAYDHYEYKEWDKCIEYYTAVERRISPEDSALHFDISERLCVAYISMGSMDKATGKAYNLVKLAPDLSIGYMYLAEIFAYSGKWKQVDHFIDEVLALGVPKTIGAIDESRYTVTPLQLKAQAALERGDTEAALAIMSKLAQMLPNNSRIKYDKLQIEKLRERNDAILAIHKIHRYIQRLNKPHKYQRLIDAIPTELKDDDQVRAMIKEMAYDFERKTKSVKLPSSKTIVVYAGPHYEQWDGNSDIEQGIGGSEGMCIQLMRELAKLGNKVFVFNEARDSDGKVFDGVTYRHHTAWNADIKCDVFISLRRPDIMSQFLNATKQLLWLHDTHYGEQPLLNFFAPDAVTALSEAHRAVLMESHGIEDPSIFFMTRNGLNYHAIEFADENAGNRDPYKLIWASSYDRGLINALKMWPKIKEAIPEATLDIYYGWTGIDKRIQGNPDDPYSKYLIGMKNEIMELIARSEGVRELGRISQDELYTRFKEAGIWFYPTEFYEISCINAMTAQAMGAIPICTPHAALKETVNGRFGFKVPLENMVDTVIYALSNQDEIDKKRESMMNWARAEYDMGKLAKEWDRFFTNG